MFLHYVLLYAIANFKNVLMQFMFIIATGSNLTIFLIDKYDDDNEPCYVVSRS